MRVPGVEVRSDAVNGGQWLVAIGVATLVGAVAIAGFAWWVFAS